MLTDPVIVYQLALRMGSSYAATCYVLNECKGIDRLTREKLLKMKPKAIKQGLAKPVQAGKLVWGRLAGHRGRQRHGAGRAAVQTLLVIRMPEHAKPLGICLEFRGTGECLGRPSGEDGRVKAEGEPSSSGSWFQRYRRGPGWCKRSCPAAWSPCSWQPAGEPLELDGA